MPSFDNLRRIFKKETKHESTATDSESLRIESLRARIKELEKERNNLLKGPSYESHPLYASGDSQRRELNRNIERINQEIENLH